MLDVYSNFMFADDHTLAQIAPSGAFLGSGPAKFPGTLSAGYVQVNCNNPLMTAQQTQLLCGLIQPDAVNVNTGNTSQDYGLTGPWGHGYDNCDPNTGKCDGAGNITAGQTLL